VGVLQGSSLGEVVYRGLVLSLKEEFGGSRPGATALTVISLPRSSRASISVIALTAPLLAA
jgi:hypothetical protein